MVEFGNPYQGPCGVNYPCLRILASGFCYPISGHYFGMQSNRGGAGINYCALTPWLIGVYDAQGYSFFENFILLHNVERFSGNPPWSWRPSTLLFIGDAVSFVALLRAGDSGSNTNPRILGLSYQSICGDLGSHRSDLSVIIGNTTTTLYLIFNRPDVRALCPGFAYPSFSTLGTTRFVCSCINARVWSAPSSVTEPNHLRDQEQLTMLLQLMIEWRIPLAASSLGLLLFEPNRVASTQVAAQSTIDNARMRPTSVYNAIVLPLISEARQQPLKEAALIAKKAKADVVSQGIRMPSFSFYRGAITREQAPTEGQWVLISLTRFQELEALTPTLRPKHLAQAGDLSHHANRLRSSLLFSIVGSN